MGREGGRGKGKERDWERRGGGKGKERDWERRGEERFSSSPK